jgi:glycosyltransferase involved in cell wall biosynthesis
LIIPVHNTEDYIRACLSSVLNSSRNDIELVVVDDASSDDSVKVIEAAASEDPRVKVVRLSENVGLGLARNAGMEAAKGEWLMFLDSDDLLVHGALERLAPIQCNTESDIIMFDYARLYGSGRMRRPSARALAPVNGQEIPLQDAPELLTVLNVAWNKAYRTSFVHRVGASFPAGYYEDIPWTYLLLMEADSVHVLDEVLLLYRQERQGRILGSASDRHLDLVCQYQTLLEDIESRGHTSWIPFTFERMIEHGTFVLAQGDKRLSPSAQQEMFRRLSEAYHRWKPPDFSEPDGLGRLRFREIEKGGDYRLHHRLLFRFAPRRFAAKVWNEAKSRLNPRSGAPSLLEGRGDRNEPITDTPPPRHVVDPD